MSKIAKKVKSPVKQSKKNDKKDIKKEIKSKIESDEEIDEEELEEEYGDDPEFFNETSYNAFIQKNNLPILNPSNFTNNDLHKVQIITPADQRITSDIMSLAEYTRAVSERAKAIENGSVIFVDVEDESDPIKIAEMEILQKKSPLNIHREINKYIIETWQINELCLPFK